MFKCMTAIVVGLLLSVTGCGPKKDAGADAGGCTDAGTLVFGAACTLACECASSVCFTFGDGTSSCTLNCAANPDCPSGSQGQKCNLQGVCKP